MGIVIDDRRIMQDTATPGASRKGGAGGRIQQVLDLLRGTRERISLFRLRMSGVDCQVVEALMDTQFGAEAIVERLPDGSIMALFLRSDDAVAGLESRVRATIMAALPAFGVTVPCRMDLKAVHRDSGTVSGLDDLLCELSAYDEAIPAGLFH